MTKKDYELIAQVFNNRKPYDMNEGNADADMFWNLMRGLSYELRLQNPRFDADKFINACIK